MTIFEKLFLGAAMVSVTGCAANPATGIAASGDPLRVKYSTGTGTYVANEVVGTDVHRDSDGNEVGTTDHYQAVERSFRWHDREYFQGRDEVDEHDFYRLAGDREAADEIQRIRDGAALKMKIGAPLMIAGLAASIVIGSIAKSSDNAGLATATYIGGSTLATVGGLVWYWGSATMKKKHHLPASRADRNADLIEQCNEGRCTTLRGGRGRSSAR